MTKKVRQYLQMDAFEYDMMLFGMWMRWVENATMTEAEFQKVLANPAVNKWYITKLGEIENQFLTMASKYPDAGKDRCRQNYNEMTYALYNTYPLPLIKEAIKIEDKGFSKLHGIKVQSLLFNQN